MTSHRAANDLDSGTVDSVASTPRSIHQNIHEDNTTATLQPPATVRFMCSFGGKILPRPHDNQLRYVGGDTRIVSVNHHATFSSLVSKLSKLSGTTNITIKYQLPSEDLDALITVTTDEDVENMMEEFDRLVQSHKSSRLRLFLFPTDSDSRASSISSLLNGSAKREHWFLDALHGRRGSGLERGQSEVSSILSEVPDYLFGLDNSDDAPRETKVRNKNLQYDNNPASDPSSPNPIASSPFCSTSSSMAPPSFPAIADLPPVRTKPVDSSPTIEPSKDAQVVENLVPQQTGYTSNPMWNYSGPTGQPMPVYYVPGPAQTGNVPIQQVPIGAQYVQSYPVPQGQVPIGYGHQVSSLGQVYGGGGGGGRPIAAIDPISGRVVTDGANQPIYYGVRNPAGMVPAYHGMVVSGAEEIQGPGIDGKMSRVSHGS